MESSYIKFTAKLSLLFLLTFRRSSSLENELSKHLALTGISLSGFRLAPLSSVVQEPDVIIVVSRNMQPKATKGDKPFKSFTAKSHIKQFRNYLTFFIIVSVPLLAPLRNFFEFEIYCWHKLFGIFRHVSSPYSALKGPLVCLRVNLSFYIPF